MPEVYHIPAMLQETISGLHIKSNGVYVDATFGGGGHSRAIMKTLGEGGRLYSFDQDMDAYQNAWIKDENGYCLAQDPRWHFVHSNFRYLNNFMDYLGVKKIDGILADIGVSFHHFDEAERGFSFRFAGPLDMRMNRQGGKTASDIINTYSEENITHILYTYGEMRNARQIAHHIVDMRQHNPITRTEQLVQCLVPHVQPNSDGELEIEPRFKKDLARLFQALRIEVNDELGALCDLLLASTQMLNTQGRIALLTYHSLEDRIVKNFFRSGNLQGTINKDFYGNILCPFKVIEKGRTATDEETITNPRSRSAKLRIAEIIH